VIVRPATTDDIPWLLAELAAFDRFFGSSRSLFPSIEYAEGVLTGVMTDHLFLVAESPHGPAGFIAGTITPHGLNPAIVVLAELFWWVAPEHRGSRAALLLLNAYVAAGKARAHWITMTIEAESPIGPHMLYRRGFRFKEASYLLEVGV
jgi:hypothetical protein